MLPFLIFFQLQIISSKQYVISVSFDGQDKDISLQLLCCWKIRLPSTLTMSMNGIKSQSEIDWSQGGNYMQSVCDFTAITCNKSLKITYLLLST